MRKLPLLIAMGFALAAEPPVKPVGEFANWRFTGEHQYGYGVQLWRQGDRLFGLFLASAGLQGDTPTGLLKDVRYEPKSGHISFRSKLSVGTTYRGGASSPSQDLFEFAGILQMSHLVGTVKHIDESGLARSQRVRLERRKHDPKMEMPATYADWKKQADDILKVRGPKW